MRNDLKKLMSVLFFTLFIVLSGWCQKHSTEFAQFPELSVKLIEADLSEKNLLDTAYLLTFDYLEFLKSLPDTNKSFETAQYPGASEYFDYIYVKGILNSLVEMEKCKDSEIRKNLLFKIGIQLKNRPFSKADLRFVYENWDLDDVKKVTNN